MTNKKLWVSLVIVVLIISMLSVSLFACKKDEEPTDTETIETKAINAIVSGIKESVATGDMKDLKVGGTLGLTVGDKEYEAKLALELDLLQFAGYNYSQATGTFDANYEYFTKKGSTYTKVDSSKVKEKDFNDGKYYIRVSRANVEHATTSNTKVNFEFKDKSATAPMLGLYYTDGAATRDIYSGDVLYLQTNTSKGSKKLQFPAPFIAAVQDAKDGQVDFSGIKLDDDDAWGTLDMVLGIIATLSTNGKLTDTEASITLNIGTLLDPNNENNLLSLVEGLGDWLSALDLDIDATALGEVLPNISLVLSATLDNGKATGFDISLAIEKKHITVNNKSKAHTLLDINMSKNLEIGLSLNYTVGSNPKYFWPSDLSTYTRQENILDAKISAELYLSSGINMSLLDGKLTLNVLPGTYKLEAEIAANPWPIIEKVNNGLDFSSTPKMIDSIKEILQAVNALELKLLRQKDENGQAVAEANQTVLHVLVGNTYSTADNGATYTLNTTAGKVDKTVNLTTSILGDGKKNLSLENANIDAAITLVNSFIDKDKDTDKGATYPAATEDDDTTKLLKEIGGYLLGAYIGINDGTHTGLFASFDSTATAKKIIPFSGYTKWQGAYNAAYDYYTKNESKVWGTDYGYIPAGSITAFAKNTKYYTKVDGHFEKVDQTKGFNNYVYYYTKDGETYTRVANDVKTFTEGVDYYLWKGDEYKEAEKYVEGTTYYIYKDESELTDLYVKATVTAADFEGTHPDYYVKGGKGEKEFGIGLSATIAVNNSGIVIDATVKNMDIFGLPGNFSAKISNLSLSLFNNNYSVYIANSGVVTVGNFSTVNGKIVTA